jgi:hypothetical protein
MTLSRKDIENHISIVGWLQIAHSVLLLLAGAFLLTILLGFGGIAGDPIADRVLAIVGWTVEALMLILALPGLVAGVGLLGRAPSSRVMALVLAVLELATFPIGTLLAGYTLFVLLQPAALEALGPCCTSEEIRMQAAGA